MGRAAQLHDAFGDSVRLFLVHLGVVEKSPLDPIHQWMPVDDGIAPVAQNTDQLRGQRLIQHRLENCEVSGRARRAQRIGGVSPTPAMFNHVSLYGNRVLLEWEHAIRWSADRSVR